MAISNTLTTCKTIFKTVGPMGHNAHQGCPQFDVNKFLKSLNTIF